MTSDSHIVGPFSIFSGSGVPPALHGRGLNFSHSWPLILAFEEKVGGGLPWNTLKYHLLVKHIQKRVQKISSTNHDSDFRPFTITLKIRSNH